MDWLTREHIETLQHLMFLVLCGLNIWITYGYARTMRQARELLAHEQHVLEVVDQGIRLMVAASGVRLMERDGVAGGEIEVETSGGLRARVTVSDVALTPKSKLH